MNIFQNNTKILTQKIFCEICFVFKNKEHTFVIEEVEKFVLIATTKKNAKPKLFKLQFFLFPNQFINKSNS